MVQKAFIDLKLEILQGQMLHAGENMVKESEKIQTDIDNGLFEGSETFWQEIKRRGEKNSFFVIRGITLKLRVANYIKDHLNKLSGLEHMRVYDFVMEMFDEVEKLAIEQHEFEEKKETVESNEPDILIAK